MLLSEIASQLGLELTGQDMEIKGVSTLEEAGPDQISFLANPKYIPMLKTTRAGCVLVEPEHAHKVKIALISQNPYLDFARVMQIFAVPQGFAQDARDAACIHPSADIHASANIHPMAFIGSGASIGSGTLVFPFVYIGENVSVGSDCVIYPNVSIMAGCSIGDRVIVHSGAVIGSDGFGFVETPQGRKKIPQLGNVVIENDVEIGANTTIDRATLGRTVIGQGVKIDNLVQVAHNVQVGEHSVLVSQVGISGSSILEDHVILGGQAGVAGHLKIGRKSRVAAKSGVGKDIPPETDCGGIPAMNHTTFLKNAVLMPKLPQAFKRIKQLENQMKAMQEQLKQGESK